MVIASHLLSDYTEKQWQRHMEELAVFLGYTYRYHTQDSRGSESGFPDLVLVKPGVRTIYFELKTDKPSSKPTQDQVDWVRALRSTGLHAWIIRPRNIDIVIEIMKGAAPAPFPEPYEPSDVRLEDLLENEKKVRQRYPRRRTKARRG